MINAILFSKDRALQLRLLLDSIAKNANGIFNINILYKASNQNFKSGYEKLISENLIENINWVEESEFKKQVIELLKQEYDYSCFFTDDDIIYEKIEESRIIETINKDIDIFCFSLRLGTNVKKCYTMNCDNVLGDFEDFGETICWEWTKRYMDFGYPLSVDGHIFRTKDIYKLVSKINFHNPNTLEGNLQIFDNFPKEKMVSYKQSKLVNSPSNIVNDTHPNRKGEQHGITVEELNNKYLNGETILLDKIDFSNIIGCHQELLFKFA